jgi:PKD repeat protein/photosystem II stability/assembly factor-like uncharacterized protein
MKKIYLILTFTFICQIFYGQWSVTNLGVNEPLYSVDYASPNEIWIGSYDGMFKSNNGGLNWGTKKTIQVSFLNYNYTEFFDVRGLGNDTAIFIGKMLGGNVQRILKTNDGGSSWFTTYTNNPFQTNSSYNALDVFNNKLIAMGTNCGTAFSYNKGNNWITANFTNGFDVVDVEYATNDTLVCITKHRIFYSTNGGGSWIFANTPIGIGSLNLENFRSVSCYRNVSYVTSSTNKLFRSIDFGSNYSIIDLPTIDSSLSTHVKTINKDTLLFCDSKGLYISKSGGKYWEKFIIPGFKKINMMDTYGNDKLIAVGNQGYQGYVLQNTQIYNSLTLPKSNFRFSSNVLPNYCYGDSIVLENLTDSLAGYSYKWLLNDTLVGSHFHQTILLNSISGINKISMITSSVNGSDTLTRKVLVIGHDLKNFTIVTNSDSACQRNFVDFIIPNSQIGVIYQLRKGNVNIGLQKNGNGSNLHFSDAVGNFNSVSYNIKALKTNQCFIDSIVEYRVISVGQTIYNEYCMPVTTSSNSGSITGFNLNGINISSASPTYNSNFNDYSCFSNTSLVLGTRYNYTLKGGNFASTHYFKIWIDLDSNKKFDLNELVVDTVLLSNAQTITGTIKISDSASVFYSKLRMRIGLSGYQYLYPCVSWGDGEFQDYSVTLLPGQFKPISNFIHNSVNACSTTFSFKSKSMNATSYFWDFGDGDSSRLRNPKHTYGLIGGNYNVRLISCNPYFCDTIVKSVFNVVPKTPIQNCIPNTSICNPFNEPSVKDVFILGLPYNPVIPFILWNSKDFTCIRQLNFVKDSSYFLTIDKNAEVGRYFVFIDFNNDGNFTSNEQIQGSGISNNSNNYQINIQIYLDNKGADSIPLRMRIISSSNSGGVNPCGPICGDYKDVTAFLSPNKLSCSFNTPTPSACGVIPATFIFNNTSKGVTQTFWDFGDNTTSTQYSPTHTYSSAGIYTIKLKTCNNVKCDSIIKTNYITVSPSAFVATINAPDTLYLCGSNTIKLKTKHSVGNTYEWYYGNSPIQSANDSFYSPTATGNYNVWVINSIGCLSQTNQIYVEVASDCVWPGDANNDLVVDQNDLLPIGVMNGTVGVSRDKVSNSWYGYIGSYWYNSTFSYPFDARYTDCNGDGIISMKDTLAINLNFNSTHLNKSSADVNNPVLNPDVSLIFNKSFYQNGDTVYADVHIGNSTSPQSNFYGASFSLNYNPIYALPGSSSFTFNDSWIGKLKKRVIKFSKIREAQGILNLSIVRTNQLDTFGYGKIGTLKFIVSNTVPSGKMKFKVLTAKKINHIGNFYTPLLSGTDSVPVIQTSGLISNRINLGFLIHPNPSNGKFEIISTTILGEVIIYNILGEIVYKFTSNLFSESIDISKQAKGTYFIKINNSFRKILVD